MPTHDSLDPRYRPEFQRGYDPRASGAAGVGDASVAPTKPLAPAVAPTESHTAPPITVTDQAAAADPGTEDADHREAEPDVPNPAPVWRNPYLIGLLVLGIALIAVGVDRFNWAVSRLYSSFTGGTGGISQADTVTPQVMWALGPLLAIAGVLTVLGVGFFVAWRWVPRRRHGTHDAEI